MERSPKCPSNCQLPPNYRLVSPPPFSGPPVPICYNTDKLDGFSGLVHYGPLGRTANTTPCDLAVLPAPKAQGTTFSQTAVHLPISKKLKTTRVIPIKVRGLFLALPRHMVGMHLDSVKNILRNLQIC